MKKLFIILIVLIIIIGGAAYLVKISGEKAFDGDDNKKPGKEDLIKVESPLPNQTVISPISIKGEARGSWFFEASFPIVLYDSTGKEIGRAIAQAKSDWMTEDFVPFESFLEFSNSGTETGDLVFKKDNPSGNPDLDDQLKIPVKFTKAVRKIQLYYYNQKQDENILCSKDAVLPIEREISFTNTPIKDAINLLLLGEITQAEKEAGFSPMFPLERVRLKGANLKNNVLILEFEDPLDKTGGGSCRVGLLWSQIEKTAKQFEGVKEVRFIPEELFQP